MHGTAHLLILARSYADFLGKPLSTVSSRVFDDGKKLDAIAAGADLYSGRLNRAIQWFSDNWPSGLDWPNDVVRPEPTPAPAS
jgi:hypothetical protein